eukprot:6649659-Pyramimonas_sp.AAC.1
MMDAVTVSTFSDGQKSLLMAGIQDKLVNGNRTTRLSGHEKQTSSIPSSVMLFFTQLDWNVVANPNVHWTSDLKATTVAA